jgi:serine/threonine protein kinase
MIGTTLGHYRIVEQIGAGGMGVVYRAHDERLDRDVAIKVLPEEVAGVQDRLARFEREAKTLASLNHSNIATLHGLEEERNTRFLVMELVAGESLSTVIARGALSSDEAVPIAVQVAQALEAAHEQGIIHRDLKPANVMVDGEGQVKVLDFGLAKAFEPNDSQQSPETLAESPTLTADLTRGGVLLGTAAYMSPEQARGKPVDKRADIWAFGCTLFEMLTGSRPFQGASSTDVLAAVIKEDIDWNLLPATVSAPLRWLLRRCLTKDPRNRLHDIADARIELKDESTGDAKEELHGGPDTAQRRSRAMIRALAATAAVAIAVAALLGFFLQRDRQDLNQPVRFSVFAPFGTTYHLEPRNPGPVSFSPDGAKLVFSARETSQVVASTGNTFDEARLYLRELSASEAVPLVGTEGAHYPFWSPDSRSIGFFADGKLKRIRVSGGPAITLCDAPAGKGGSWAPGGDIIFSPTSDGPIHRLSEAGGVSTPITDLNGERGDYSHRHPKILPGGQHFLYLALTNDRKQGPRHAVVVSPLGGGAETVLLRSNAAADYASGHLLFIRETTLMAWQFDVDRLEFTGEPAPVCERIAAVPGAGVAVFSAASSDILACQSTDSVASSRLEWFDRNGRKIGTLGDPADYLEVELSPDGTKAAVGIFEQSPEDGVSPAKQSDIWIYSIERGVADRLTFDHSREDQIAWSPDGQKIAFGRRLPRNPDIYVKTVGEADDAKPLLESDLYALPTSWSPNGKILAFDSLDPETGWDQWILSLGDGAPVPFLKSSFNEADGVFSPDGRWMAYESDESGRWEIYVTSFPGPGRRWRVSTRGGVSPRWNSTGQELFFRSAAGDLMAVAMTLDDGDVLIGTPKPLIEGQLNRPNLAYHYSPAPGGERFLLITDQRGAESLDIILNWTELLP